MVKLNQLKSILEDSEPEKHKSTKSLRETVRNVINAIGEFENQSFIQTADGVEFKQELAGLRKELTDASRKPVKSVRKSLAKCRDFIEKIEEVQQNSISESEKTITKSSLKKIPKEGQRFFISSTFDQLDENAPKIARTILR